MDYTRSGLRPRVSLATALLGHTAVILAVVSWAVGPLLLDHLAHAALGGEAGFDVVRIPDRLFAQAAIPGHLAFALGLLSLIIGAKDKSFLTIVEGLVACLWAGMGYLALWGQFDSYLSP